MDRARVALNQSGRKTKYQDNSDSINELPECIQSYILSKLTMKDLVKTRILSKRWLKLWELRRNLVFDIPNMFNMDFSDLCELNGRMFMDHEYLGEIIDEFVTRVGDFLLTFPGRKIDSLEITLYPDFEKYSTIVAYWFKHAISMDVEEIKLLSSSLVITHCKAGKWEFHFPFWRFSSKRSLKQLKLQRCILRLAPPYFAAFCSLKTLQLETSVVGYDFMASLLSNCLSLEVLSLKCCSLPDNLEIFGPSLHHLELTNSFHRGNATISCTKLTVFECHNTCSVKHTVLLNAPQLAKIVIHTWAEDWVPPLMSQFTDLAQLENLNLHVFSGKKATLPRNTVLSPLWNLKQLELTFLDVKILGYSDLMWVVLLLKASPLLQKLTLRRVGTAVPGYFENESERERWEPLEFTHNQLKEVEIASCVGNWYETEFAIFILETVQSLEQMVFNPSRKYYLGGGKWMDDEVFVPLDAHRHWLESGREIVLEKLRGKGPATAKLVLL